MSLFLPGIKKGVSKMRRKSLFGILFWLSAYILHASISIAEAQIVPSDRPQPIQVKDRFGVDLVSGSFIYASDPVSVGPQAAPSMDFIPVSNTLFLSPTTPLMGSIQLYSCGGADGCEEFYSAWLGTETIVFPRYYYDNSDYTVSFTGETLILSDTTKYSIYRKDGSRWDFSKSAPGNISGQVIFEVGTLAGIVFADGRELAYQRSGSDVLVTSTDGYAYHSSNSTRKLVNRKTQYCGIGAANCIDPAGSPIWPRATVIGAGQTQDALNRVTTVQTSQNQIVISRPNGLVETVQRSNAVLVNNVPNCFSCGYYPLIVTSYSSQLGSSSYIYEGNSIDGIVKGRSTRSGNRTVEATRFEGASTYKNENGQTYSQASDAFPTYGWASRSTPSNLRSITHPELSRLEWDYNTKGNIVTSRAVPKGQSGVQQATRGFATNCPDYYSCYRPSMFIDARGKQTDYEYDSASGLVSKETLPANESGIRPQNRYTYQQLQASYIQTTGGTPQLSGKPIWKLYQMSRCSSMSPANCIGTNDEIITVFGYDGNLQPISETVKDGTGATLSIKTREYDAVGNIVWEDGPQAGTVDRRYFFWDAGRQLVGTITPASPANRAVRTYYNSGGKPYLIQEGTVAGIGRSDLEAMVPDRETFIVYDGITRKVREEVRPYGGMPATVTQYSYDTDGNLECTAIRMNPAAFVSLPASACALGSTGSNGPDRITKNEYDAAGQLTKVIKAYGVTTANGFPATLQQDYATYTYTPNGKREYVTDANGNRSRFIYDGFDRLFQWNFPDKTTPGVTSSTDYEAYQYDANGNRIYLRKRDGQIINYSYDALNRVTLKDIPGTATGDAYYGYDLRGLQTYARFGSASGDGIGNAYDGLGRLSSSTNNMGGVSRTLSYQYDAYGNRTRLTFPDNQYFTYEYDALNRMTAIRENGGTEIASFSYNAKGERIGIGGGFNTSFSYDGISRLAGITHEMAGTGQDVTFCMGTMSGSTCNPVYNAASQILNRTISNSAYVWNGHANVNRGYAVNGLNQYMTAGSASFSYDPNGNLTSDGSTTYAYDVENRLLSASGATSASLSWDPMGRLWQTVGSATTRFLYDGDELVGEYDTSGNLLRRYIHGSGNDDPLVWYEGSGLGDRRHLRTDHQGSIVAISNSAGSSIGLNGYDEYGIPGSGNIGRFAYTGQIRIPELGMYHYKARIYSPTLGRFLQTDPIGYDDQINLYAYVANDPLNHTDPTGNETGTFSNGCMGDSCMNIDPGGKVHRAALWGMVGVASLFVGPEVLGIRFGAAVTVRVGNALFKAGEAASTRLAENAITKAANATLSGLAKGEGRVIAGNGSKDALRAGESLAKKYGGEASDYQKVSSATIAESSNGAKVEVHAYRNVETGKIYEPKIKVQGGSQ